MQSFDTMLSAAESEIDTGRFGEVIEQLRQGLSTFLLPLQQTKIHLRIADALLKQKKFKESILHLNAAEPLLWQCQNESPAWKQLYLDFEIGQAWCIYFNLYHHQKLDDCLNRINGIIHEYGTTRQRLAFLACISLGLMRRHQWYNLPPESVTHSLFAYEIAAKENNVTSMASILGELGMIYMFRNEWKTGIDYYLKCIAICGAKEANFKIIATNYLAVCYRMWGKLAECENWAQKTLQIAQQHNVIVYEAMADSNLAWCMMKRNHLLQTEQKAKSSLDILDKVFHPFLWLPVLPLLWVCQQQKDWRQAGEYAFVLFLPLRKKLPEKMEHHLRKMIEAWQQEHAEIVLQELEEVLTEAQISGYL